MRVARVCAAALCLLAAGAQAVGETWSRQTGPSPGLAQAVGSPAAGCLAGAVALAQDGDGYQALRPARNRFWGHPDTIRFVRDLGAAVKQGGLGTVLAGDLSQPRGGPMGFGHGSHQNGLDVDIWYLLPSAPLSPAQQDAPMVVSMVKNGTLDPKRWSVAQEALLELAASRPGIDRIFVNPVIKQAMCRRFEGAPWLARLRPWWGHDEHFHVRLSCPAGDAGCTPPKPVPPGDGCGTELTSWFKEAAVHVPGDKPNTRRPSLPAACGVLLEEVRTAGAK